MRLSTQALAALFLLPSDSVSANNTLRGRRRLPGNAIGKTKNKHPLDESPCILLLKEIKFLDGSESEEADCLEPTTGAISKITGPQGTQKIFLDGFKNGELMSNVSTLRKNGAQAYFDDDSGELVLPDWDHLVIGHGNPNANKNGRELWKHVARSDDETRMVGDGSRRSLATVIGDKEMLAIRVVAPDASMSSSESEISDSWFGTSGDLVNLKSQYEACSYGQLRCEGASKTTSTGATVSNGVHTIEISSTVSGVADGTVRTAVVNEATTALGSLSGQFDHVILCLPPGTAGSWIAYAYVNHWLSVYNDEWCNYVSGQMHEIGHNLNLAHSGEGTLAYGDQTGMMGYSYSSDDGPEMCFNAPKNWQLGWYNDGQKVVTSGWSGNLYGIADYGTIDSGSVVIAQIPASVNGGTDDWYVSFNRKAGINAGTVEGGNQVLVHKRASGTGYAESTLMAKLSAGGTYSGAPLPIEVSAIDISQSPGFATVLIGTLATPAPVTPAPVTPAPVTPAPVTPAPVTSAPVTPAPVTPAPVTPAPVTPAPVTSAPVTPAPVTSAPVTPAPVTPAPVTSAPVTPAPVTSAPVTPAPVTPAPVTSAPVTPAPATPAPVTPAPVTPAPVTPAPVTPAPVTPAPVTPAPITSAPVTPAPITSAPVTPAPVTSAPVTPAPVTPAPVTSAPVTPAPVTPAPVTSAPITSAPVTPAPVTPAPVTSAPVTPAPVTPAPTTPVEICSIDTCDACSEGGECKSVGCMWRGGICKNKEICGPNNCSACWNGGMCKKNGCSWSKGQCS